jgi:hypothetical protein
MLRFLNLTVLYHVPLISKGIRPKDHALRSPSKSDSLKNNEMEKECMTKKDVIVYRQMLPGSWSAGLARWCWPWGKHDHIGQLVSSVPTGAMLKW